MPEPKKKPTRACVDAAWSDLERATAACRPTRQQRRAAAALAATEIRVVETSPWGARGLLVGLVFVVVILMCLLTGCVPVEAIRQAEVEAAIMHGHAGDAALTSESRAIGAAGERAWRAQHRALAGEDVPQAARQPVEVALAELGREALAAIEERKAPLAALGRARALAVLAQLGAGREDEARLLYLAAGATLAERLAASEALTLATLAATRERELAWDEVRSLLQDAGQLALRVLIPVLLAAL